MSFKDLRDFIQSLERERELLRVDGADWDVEIGTIAELVAEKEGPAVLFDRVKDYPEGYRVVTNLFSTTKRLALVSDLAPDASKLDVANKWSGESFKPVPPVEVKSGPVMENILQGDMVDVLKFPVPKYHELDGGRYIGTGHIVIMKDPDEGWVNCGVQRVMVHDEKTLGLYISPGKHNRTIMNKYLSKGLNCPVALALGPDPVLYMSGAMHVDWGISELDWAGWMRGGPIEVVKGEITGLPLPAHDEIVIEGEIPPGEEREEGPFGEWTGYYAPRRQESVIKVKAIYHRNDPILNGVPPLKPPLYAFRFRLHSVAPLLDNLRGAGVSNVKNVWQLEAGGGRLLTVVSIQQDHEGHAKQAGLVAAGSHGAGYMGRFVVVVDDDIDPTDINDVAWAIATRCDPETDIDIIRNCWGSRLDPRIPPERRERGELTHSVAIINACKPWHWKDRFPSVNKASPELRQKVIEKWKDRIPPLRG